ncbi:hypothetical protein CFP56_007620 [Quercus suber]|uniref:Uncharacterized protein n=1 Tax=Quercus suber TaxID=58331 RepID=A0AAW0L534_QUESU
MGHARFDYLLLCSNLVSMNDCIPLQIKMATVRSRRIYKEQNSIELDAFLASLVPGCYAAPSRLNSRVDELLSYGTVSSVARGIIVLKVQ